MNSMRDQVVDAILAALNTPAPPLGVPLAERDRSVDIVAPESIVLYQVRSQNVRRVPDRYGPLMAATLEIWLELRATGTEARSSSQVFDDLYVHVVQRLGGSNLGGLLSNELNEGDLEFDYDVGTAPIVKGTLPFLGDYQYLVADPTSRQ